MLAEVGPRSIPAHQQTRYLRRRKATSAIGPNVLKIFSFTESCNSCHISLSLCWFCCDSHNKSLNLLWCANVEQSPTSSLCHHSPRLPSYKWWNTFENLSPKHRRAISSSPECSLCQGRQTPLWRFLPPRPEHQIKTLAFIPFTQFVSSDRSSYSDGGRLYIDTAAFWDFEHFCQYI